MSKPSWSFVEITAIVLCVDFLLRKNGKKCIERPPWYTKRMVNWLDSSVQWSHFLVFGSRQELENICVFNEILHSSGLFTR